MGQFIVFIVLLLLGIFAGSYNERRHFARLQQDEAALAHIKVFNLKQVPDAVLPGGVMVMGNTVIALDYFKKIMAVIRQIFGGRLNSY